MNRYDPAEDPNVRLVGRKLPGVRLGDGVPALDQLKDQVKRTGGLDITHIKFHGPLAIPVTKDNKLYGWGVACMGCSIENNGPVMHCLRYTPEQMFHAWPESPLLVEAQAMDGDEPVEPEIQPQVRNPETNAFEDYTNASEDYTPEFKDEL